jgi:crotonobetainyl-CoA:carnitine CoA-transferase CaiB-like acyl-CoA transferase
MMALRARDQQSGEQLGEGQVVDVALYESMFNLLEAVIPEYHAADIIRQPSGTTVTGIVPTNTYKCADGKYLVIGGNGDSIFMRLMQAVGREDMSENEAYATNAGRVRYERDIDAVLKAWCADHKLEDAINILESKRVPCGPVYNAEDMMNDPHFNERGLFEQVEINGEPLKIPAILPKLKETPGSTEWPGPDLGSHTDEVLATLGMDTQKIADLKARGVIADAN